MKYLRASCYELFGRHNYRATIPGRCNYRCGQRQRHWICHVATVPCKQNIHAVNRRSCNMGSINSLIDGNSMLLAQRICQTLHFGYETVQHSHALQTALAKLGPLRISTHGFLRHIRRDENVAPTGKLLPPLASKSLLDGDMRQRRSAAVQVTPERRLAIDLQSLFRLFHDFSARGHNTPNAELFTRYFFYLSRCAADKTRPHAPF